MSKRICGAKKRQGEGVCRQAAGWGTDHPGEGPCKLHCGSAIRRGQDSAAFKHGLYAKHLGKEEAIEFEQFAARFNLAQVSDEDKFAFYRVYKALCLPGPLSLPVASQALMSLCRAKAALLSALQGQTVRLRIEGADLDSFLRDVARVLVKYVPDDKLEAALAELDRLGKVKTADSA